MGPATLVALFKPTRELTQSNHCLNVDTQRHVNGQICFVLHREMKGVYMIPCERVLCVQCALWGFHEKSASSVHNLQRIHSNGVIYCILSPFEAAAAEGRANIANTATMTVRSVPAIADIPPTTCAKKRKRNGATDVLIITPLDCPIDYSPPPSDLLRWFGY